MSTEKYVGKHRKPTRLGRLKAYFHRRKAVSLVYASGSRFGRLSAEDRTYPSRRSVYALCAFVAAVAVVALSGGVRVIPADTSQDVALVSADGPVVTPVAVTRCWR